MAILKNFNVGTLSGKLGDKSCKTRKNKTILSKRPGHLKFHPNRVPAQRKFCHAVWLSTHCINIPLLKKIWQHSNPEAYSAYHSLIRKNSKASAEGQLTEKNVITPPGLILDVKEVILEKYGLKAHLEITNGCISSPFHAVVVICSFIPGCRTRNGNRFYSIVKEVIEEDGKEFNLFFNPYPFQLNWINNYQKWIIYFALVKDDAAEPVWTSTGCKAGFVGI